MSRWRRVPLRRTQVLGRFVEPAGALEQLDQPDQRVEGVLACVARRRAAEPLHDVLDRRTPLRRLYHQVGVVSMYVQYSCEH